MAILEGLGIETGKGKYHEEAVYSLALIYNVLREKVTVYLDDFGLTPGKFNVLFTIKHRGREQGISQVDVSKQLIVTKANLTKLIIKLEKDGLVARSSLAGDKRVNILKITPKGARLLDQVWDGYNAILKDLLAGFSENQRKMLSALLVQWLNDLRG